VKLTKDPEGRATTGGSSGSLAALIMAWYHPELSTPNRASVIAILRLCLKDGKPQTIRYFSCESNLPRTKAEPK
jgi:hypothetical protein